MFSEKIRRCPDCNKRLEIVYSGREEANVYMCMNDKCKSYAKAFGRYVRNDNTEQFAAAAVTLDNWM